MLRAIEIYSDNDSTLIAVESVVMSHGKFPSGGHLHGQIEPIAVIVSSKARSYALDIDGTPADLDALLQIVPGLATLMA